MWWLGGVAARLAENTLLFALLPLGALCACLYVCVREMLAFALDQCLSASSWLYDCFASVCVCMCVCACVYISGVMFATGSKFHGPTFPVSWRAITPAICPRVYVCVCVFMHVCPSVIMKWSRFPPAPLQTPFFSFLSKPSPLLFIHCGWEDPSPFPPFHSSSPSLFSLSLHSPNYPYSSEWPLLQSLWSYFSANST